MVEREIIDILRTYLLKLEAAGISIEKAYLFGSYAKGEQTKHSDIDIMIVSELLITVVIC